MSNIDRKNPRRMNNIYRSVSGGGSGATAENIEKALTERIEDTLTEPFVGDVIDSVAVHVHSKGTQGSSGKITTAGFVRDIVTLYFDVKTSGDTLKRITTGVIISTPEAGGAIIREEQVTYANAPVKINRYASETYDEVLVDLIRHDIGDDKAEIGDYLVIRNDDAEVGNICKVLTGYLISFALRVHSQNNKDNGYDYVGIEGLVDGAGNLVYDTEKLDERGLLPVTADFTAVGESQVITNEYGNNLDPAVMLNINSVSRNYAQENYRKTLNLVSEASGNIVSTPVSASIIFVGPEAAGVYGANTPGYKSFALQLIAENIDHGNVPNIGKSLLALTSLTYLYDSAPRLISSDNLQHMEVIVNTKGAVNPKPLTAAEAENNFNSFRNFKPTCPRNHRKCNICASHSCRKCP